jgi:hypothetical protein
VVVDDSDPDRIRGIDGAPVPVRLAKIRFTLGGAESNRPDALAMAVPPRITISVAAMTVRDRRVRRVRRAGAGLNGAGVVGRAASISASACSRRASNPPGASGWMVMLISPG